MPNFGKVDRTTEAIVTLLEYMSWKKWDEETAAQRFQTSIWTVRHMTRRSEPRKPGRELARRIVEATGGAVNYADLFEPPAILREAG